jgi:hypothetical protein
MLPDFRVDEVDVGRRLLMGDSSVRLVDTVVMYGADERLDSQRSPFSHAIYVERNEVSVYGIVVFFGLIRLYCRLGSPAEGAPQAACVAMLSPVDGRESAGETSLLRFAEPQFGLDANGRPKFSAELPRLNEAAEQTFAKEAETLRSELSSG